MNPLTTRGSQVAPDALRALASTCLRNSTYNLTQGSQRPSYFDVDELLGRVPSGAEQDHLLADVVRAFLEFVKQQAEETGATAIVVIERDAGPVGLLACRELLSQSTGLPTLVVRPRKRIPSLAVKGGRLQQSTPVLLLTDVTTTGRAVAEAADPILNSGARIAAALSLVDREEGAREYLDNLDIPLRFLTTIAELNKLRA